MRRRRDGFEVLQVLVMMSMLLSLLINLKFLISFSLIFLNSILKFSFFPLFSVRSSYVWFKSDQNIIASKDKIFDDFFCLGMGLDSVRINPNYATWKICYCRWFGVGAQAMLRNVEWIDVFGSLKQDLLECLFS